jgi:hypothetical protein
MYSLFLYIFAVHVSGAICTHPQEHKLQSTALGVCNVWKAEVITSAFHRLHTPKAVHYSLCS